MENCDDASRISNDSLSLKNSSRNADTWTVGTEHRCQKVMRKGRNVGVGSVVSQEAPPRKTLATFV